MILQALYDLYGRMAEEEGSDIAPFGYSRQKITFEVVIEPDGTLFEIRNVQQPDEKGKLRPLSIVVPGGAKPSGSGINPGLLWDNTSYMLGYKPEDNKPERTRQTFDAFRDRHIELASDANEGPGDEEFSAVAKFLSNWNPGDATNYSELADVTTGFGVFRVRGRTHNVHDAPMFQAWWERQLTQPATDAKGAMTATCLVTGNRGPIARLHEPKIKGVAGAQSAGAPLVSFNSPAYESHGFEQAFNAPVSEEAAFRYCTALNRLLADSRRRIRIGDATTVYWTEQPTSGEALFGFLLDPAGAEDESLKSKLASTLSTIRDGSYPTELGQPETPFYVLGLSPNAARSVVRFWHQSTLEEMTDRLGRHFEALRLVRAFPEKEPEFPSVWHLLRETARESKDIPPLLGGALMRAILTGGHYPQTLLATLVRRLRADRDVRYIRIAAIKACLIRSPQPTEVPVSLDPDRPEPAYQLGRLFACLERAQEDALPGLSDTIRDRFFGAASATPAAVFPRLVRLNQHHMGKLEGGRKVVADRRLQEVYSHIEEFPKHLNLREQGLFAVGYYHQRRDFFTKKSTDASDHDAAIETASKK